MSIDIVLELLEKENEKPKEKKNKGLGNFLVKVRDSGFEDLNYLRVKSINEGKNLASRLVITEMIKRLNAELKDLGGRINIDKFREDEAKDKDGNRPNNEKQGNNASKQEKPVKEKLESRTVKRVDKRVGEKK